MSLKDKIKAWTKSPFFWIVVAIGFIGISILVISMISGKDKCPPGTSRGQCGDKCVPVCPSGKYDCSTNKCVCPGGETICNGACCPDKKCIDGLCCSKNRQCPTGPGGEMQCCSDTQICDPTSKTCVSTCAVKGNECKSGESCLSVGPINKTLQDKFNTDFPRKKYPSALCESNICSVCVPESACKFDADQPSPAALKEVNGDYYPCTNIIRGTDENGDEPAYCSSDIAANALSCNTINTTKAECMKANNCKWRNIFDKAVTHEVINTDIANIGSEPKIVYEGNWCGTKGQFLHVDKMSQSNGSTCDVTACWNELNKHTNVTDIHWDDVGKVCTSVASCDTDTPVGFSSPCSSDAEQPSICKDYTCATTGEITKPIPDKCTPYTTCNAVVNSGKTDIGWCINETAPGMYEQSCALSEDACSKQGPGAIFVTSPYMCPYSTKPGSPGCGPDNFLNRTSDGTFTCYPETPESHIPEQGLCGSYTWNVDSIKTLVFNRTRWPIIMGGVTGDGDCTSGKTCGISGPTIPSYSWGEYDAGARNSSAITPVCTYTASIPVLGTDKYSISLSDGHIKVTPPASTSNLAKSVKCTYKMWSYNFPVDIVSIIFYPAWEMSAADAKITN